VVRERREEAERLHARRHELAQVLGDLGGVRRRQRRDSGAGVGFHGAWTSCYQKCSAVGSLRYQNCSGMLEGMAVRGSRTGRRVMKVLDVLGRRWSLRVLWELRDGPLNFRALRAACDLVSPSSLNRRLAELRELGVVEAREDLGYSLTPAGGEL